MIRRSLTGSTWLVLALALVISISGADAAQGNQPCAGLTNATILIIRHAEKPQAGVELNPTGVLRAKAYVGFFQSLHVDGQPFPLDHIFCTADSQGSQRPRLTVTPLGEALKLPLDNRFKNKDAAALAQEIRAQGHGRHMLICWHHGEIPTLMEALGADPQAVLPSGTWPEAEFGWMIELSYDDAGRLKAVKCVNEKLMPDDVAVPRQP